ncbi:NADPH:quinone reductase [Specibacter cremeus]|uniref:NADPH:quinone reductase n=1 Tax=Specibacter cremeus TaxID=1629051 RepID=UPI001F0CA3D7|nr:NADPH:quinone reductase [Specibacter cremeus]
MAHALMKAAYIRRLGGPETIEYSGLPTPGPPGPDTVLVRVAATAVNHVDTYVRGGRFATELHFPQVVGRDLVGVVEQAGAGFRVGDAVWSNSMGYAGRPGAAAEFVAVPADRLYPLPAGVDPVQAVAVLHPGATAHLALHGHAHIQPGETVFVGGAAGQVGSALVVQAVRAGARVIASASAADGDYCRSLGAAVVLDYRSETYDDELAAVRDVTGGSGVDVHIETSGRHRLDLAVELLALRGRIIVLAGVATDAALPVGKLYTRDGGILGFAISNATVAELAGAASAVNALLAAGALRARRIEQLPLHAMADAHRRLESGRVHGVRLVLRP